MTTRVVGQTSGKEVEVTGDTARVRTETGRTLFIKDNGDCGEVWKQLSVMGFVLPIPLSPFRNIVKVDVSHPKDTIWTGDEDRDVIFEVSS